MNRTIKTLALVFTLALPAALSACAPTRTSESTGQYVDDSTMTAKVKAAILGDPDLKVLQIEVKTYKGTVQLSGFVDRAPMIARAGEVARHVEGVASVRNDLIVK